MLAPSSRSALVRMQTNLCKHLRQVANRLNAEFTRRRMGITVDPQAAIDAMTRNPTVYKRFADADDRSGVLHDEQIATAVEEGVKPQILDAIANALRWRDEESLVKITLAEKGGIGGEGVWGPVESGMTPGHENEDMKRYIAGGFVEER